MRIWLKMQGTEEPLFSCKEEGRHGYKELDSITAESNLDFILKTIFILVLNVM